ncbi:MAG: LysM peptidoglycan-binding domain-containing protein [Sulfitobacter sp.]
MSDKRPKIAFSPTPIAPTRPAATPETHAPSEASAKDLVARPAAKTTPRAKVAFTVPEPVAPAYAAAGLMPSSDRPARMMELVQRHSTMLVVSGICTVTFVLGMTAALWWIDEKPQAALPIPQQQIAAASIQVTDQDVTRTAVSGLGELRNVRPNARTFVPVAQAAPARPEWRTGELARETARALIILDSADLEPLRADILAGDYRIAQTGDDGAPRMILKLSDAGTAAASRITDVLTQAYAAGLFTVPAALKTPSGETDLDTLIFNVSQTALATDGTDAGASAARDMSRKIFAASTMRTQQIAGQRTYTIAPGDSLAYLALQFYGKPSEYERIFEANRETLHSPEKIQQGQRLIIPG